jgi:hypothetical protein
LYNNVVYAPGYGLEVPTGTELYVEAYVKNLSASKATAWVGVVEGSGGAEFLGGIVQKLEIGALMIKKFRFPITMPNSDYNACIKCGEYEDGHYYSGDAECCVSLQVAGATPDVCNQGFLVKDQKTGRGISSAQVKGANKLNITDSGGWATLEAGRGSINYVTVHADSYKSQTRLITWNCYTSIIFKMEKETTPEPEPAVETELLWDGDQPTAAGVDQSVDFKFKLKLTTGDVLNEAEVGLVVDGQAVGAKVLTSNYGNVRLSRAFKAVGDHKVYAVFATTYDYKGSTSTEKTVKVTAPTSAYRVIVEGIPEGKKYYVKSYEGSSDRYWDPRKKYEVTSINNRCDILRNELASPNVTRTMRLYDEADRLIYTGEEARALKSTNDILEVRLGANQGLNFRINMSHLPNAPAVGEAFNVNATIIKGQRTPVGANQPVVFKEEIAEGQYETEGQARHTNDFGMASCQYPGREEGTYKFIAVYKYEDATCDPHTVTVGGKGSDLVSFLEPVFVWVGDAFNVDEETAKTYTYVGAGVLGLAFLGKLLGGGGGK